MKMTNEKALWYASENHIPVLGHRGICAKYPENTMPSFRAAIELGVDLIEFDVNVTRDGELVVIHDNAIDRTSNKTGLTRDYTLAELKSFDFGCRFNEKFKGETIPTLRELLTLAATRDNLLLNVEIKDMEHETVDKTVAMLKEFGLAERSVIACFDAEIIRYTKKAHPEMRTQGFPGRYMKNFTEDTYDCMFGMGIPICWADSTDEVIRSDVEFAKSRGILAWLFCADTEEDVKRCVAYGCDNITGNNPEVALRTLREMNLHT
jgi:glycerophosphoryl diester phosphodiesterase